MSTISLCKKTANKYKKKAFKEKHSEVHVGMPKRVETCWVVSNATFYMRMCTSLVHFDVELDNYQEDLTANKINFMGYGGTH